MQQNVSVCFVDFEKAFDRVKRNKLIVILLIGIGKSDISVVQNLNGNQEAARRIGIGLSYWFITYEATVLEATVLEAILEPSSLQVIVET